MRTIRRIYFYLVAFVSMEVVLWGMIGLLRSFFSQDNGFSGSTQLAQGLALILVGVPVFWLHWSVAQRDAQKDTDEHASWVRALFLYAALLATLIPVIQNFLAIINRLFLETAQLSRSSALFGGTQGWVDNFLALLMNALIAAYFLFILRRDWKMVSPRDAFISFRRVYRYMWVLYGLALTVAGVQQLVSFICQISTSTFVTFLRPHFINGLALAVVGTPIWFFAWKTVQDALVEQPERESLLRLGLLYAFALAGVVTVLVSGGLVFDALLRWIMGESFTFAGFMQKISGPLSIGIPMGGIWAYYGSWLTHSMSEVPDAPRRAGMRRLYFYILSAIGLVAIFIALSSLFSFVVDTALGGVLWAESLRTRLAGSLATLLASFPLWWLTWRPMQAEALTAGDAGDHARRSLVRKIYLYLALFAAVIGGMVSAGILLFTLINRLLGGSSVDFIRNLLKALEVLILFALLGFYHGLTLRKDGQTAGIALAGKHTDFPVLIFDVENGTFGPDMLAAIQKQTPGLPATLQLASQPVPKEAAPKAVVLPSDLVLDGPESLKKWLATFNGVRLMVPRAAQDWIIIGQSIRPPINQAAQALRQLAEGQEVRIQNTSAWQIALYIVLGLIGTPILLSLVGTLVSSFMY
jgi:hypothetical protein